MTAEEKKSAAGFLDLTADYLLDGYRRPHAETGFEDDAAAREVVRQEAACQEAAPPASFQELRQPSPLSPQTGVGALSDSLEAIAEEVRRCGACRLGETRTHGVPGEGVSAPLVMVIGEGPGADEDESGRPFVGRAGQLLDKMLGSIGLSRQKNCFIANVVKCRPPQNRDPQPDEVIFCGRFLKRQIALLKPKVILCAGRIAAQTMLHTDTGIGKLRGRFEQYQAENVIDDDDGIAANAIPLLVTYHPSALLRNDDYKRPAWEDLKMLRARLAELDGNYARDTAHEA
jgi:DNA polymerase